MPSSLSTSTEKFDAALPTAAATPAETTCNTSESFDSAWQVDFQEDCTNVGSAYDRNFVRLGFVRHGLNTSFLVRSFQCLFESTVFQNMYVASL